jgi:hypothetical protein
MHKCKICGAKFSEIEDLYDHLEEEHPDQIPKNFTVPQFQYYLKTGREHGNCVVCKRDTPWNEATNKYARFCGRQSCTDKYKEQFRERMIGKHGRVHLLDDPEQQKKMLANRSISGTYKWSDGGEVGYTGTYELHFLRFLDNFMNFTSSDIMSPSPHTYYYLYEGMEKFYIPDFFIPSLNLEIEIKDGGDNPNNHHKIQGVDKVKEKLKDGVLTSQKEFSYVKVVNKNYDSFFEVLMKMKEEFQEHGEKAEAVHVLTESVFELPPEPEKEKSIEEHQAEVDEALNEINQEPVLEKDLKQMNKAAVEGFEQFRDGGPTNDELRQQAMQTKEMKEIKDQQEGKDGSPFEREQLLLRRYNQIASPLATKDELEYCITEIDAELDSLRRSTIGINMAFVSKLRELKKLIRKRLVDGDFPK